MKTEPGLEALRRRAAPVEIGAEEFRSIGHQLVDQLANRLAAIPQGPVTHDESTADVRRLLRAEDPLPQEGAAAADLLSDTTTMLFDHSLFNGHPRFFGYITASPAPIGMFGDFIAAAVNQNVGAWKLAPMATEIEAQVIRWIAELIGFPAGGAGLLVSGGNMANFVCLLAARAAKAGWNVRDEGMASNRARVLVYASTETHTWLQKAADMSGLGTQAIRWIPVDDGQRMDVSALRRQIEQDAQAGYRPFMVVGTAGSVSTGVVDPLPEIATICREHDMWFHVDGAYGGLAAQVPGAPDDLSGLSQADSVAVDPHKWLYAPLEAGCVLVRDARTLVNAFSYHPAYYHFDGDVVNFFDYGPQNSRGFRALKVWLALRQAGRAGALKMIADDILLARHLHGLMIAHPEFEATSQALSITTFRYVPADLRGRVGSPDVERYLNELNQQLLTAVEQSGEAFLSNAMIGERYLLRACIVNFHTTLDDIEQMPGLLLRLGRQVDSERRLRS